MAVFILFFLIKTVAAAQNEPPRQVLSEKIAQLLKYRVSLGIDRVEISINFSSPVKAQKVKLSGNNSLAFDFSPASLPGGKSTDTLSDPMVKELSFFETTPGTIRMLLVTTSIEKCQTGQFEREDGGVELRITILRPGELEEIRKARENEIEHYKKRGLPIVVIDPGHGGKDPGAISRNNTLLEKNISLTVAKFIRDFLNDSGRARAYLTRSGDYFLSLDRRTEIAREYGADIFISIHVNANQNPLISGSEVYYISDRGASNAAAELLAERENSSDEAGGISGGNNILAGILLNLTQNVNIKESAILATLVLQSIKSMDIIKTIPPMRAGFRVLRNMDVPSILLEIAYISNENDLEKLKSQSFLKTYARAVASGVTGYLSSNRELEYSRLTKVSGLAPCRPEEDMNSRNEESTGGNITQGNSSSGTGNDSSCRIYVIRKGDTLSKVASRFGIRVADIIEANQITDFNRIPVGFKLRIPVH